MQACVILTGIFLIVLYKLTYCVYDLINMQLFEDGVSSMRQEHRFFFGWVNQFEMVTDIHL